MSGYQDDYQSKWPFCFLYSYKMCCFYTYVTDSHLLNKSSKNALAPPTQTSGMMLNDEHIQLHLFPVLTSKKFLALCVEHPNTRSISEAQAALILAPLFLHADCEEDTFIIENCALCKSQNFVRKEKKMLCGQGSFISLPVRCLFQTFRQLIIHLSEHLS